MPNFTVPSASRLSPQPLPPHLHRARRWSGECRGSVSATGRVQLGSMTSSSAGTHDTGHPSATHRLAQCQGRPLCHTSAASLTLGLTPSFYSAHNGHYYAPRTHAQRPHAYQATWRLSVTLDNAEQLSFGPALPRQWGAEEGDGGGDKGDSLFATLKDSHLTPTPTLPCLALSFITLPWELNKH